MRARIVVAIGAAVSAAGVVAYDVAGSRKPSQDAGLGGLAYLGPMFLIGIGALVAMIGFLAWIGESSARRRRLRETGRTAETALRITEANLAGAIHAQRCATCRGKLGAVPEEDVRFDDRELHVIRLSCARCGKTRALYVDATPAAGP